MELWRTSDWLKNDKKTFESQAESTNSGVPGLHPAESRYNTLWTNGRARRVRF